MGDYEFHPVEDEQYGIQSGWTKVSWIGKLIATIFAILLVATWIMVLLAVIGVIEPWGSGIGQWAEW